MGGPLHRAGMGRDGRRVPVRAFLPVKHASPDYYIVIRNNKQKIPCRLKREDVLEQEKCCLKNKDITD